MSVDFLILGAMDSEIQAFLTHADLEASEAWGEFEFFRIKLNGQECILAKSGVGKVLATMLTQYAIDRYQPKRVIFSGVAGALNADYEIGDVVLARDLLQHDIDGRALGFKRGQILFSDMMEVRSDAELLSKAKKADLHGHNIHVGRVLTGDQFFTHADMDSHQYIYDEMAGDAIEMEGAAVGLVAQQNTIPFLVIRTISDKADGSASLDFNEMLDLVADNSYQVTRQLLESF